MFGDLDELHARGMRRVEELGGRGIDDAVLYDGRNSSVGGTHAMFIFRGRAEEYNLPPAPEAPTVHLRTGWQSAAVAAGLMLFGTALAFLTGAPPSDDEAAQDRAPAHQRPAPRPRR